MKILFLGTGSAFTMKNKQTNIIVERNGKKLLIDCGMDIRHSLAGMGLSYKDIDALYVTHLHADHIGGIEYLAFTTYFDLTVTGKVSLIGNDELVRELWDTSLKGGLKSIQNKMTRLEDYFNLQMIKKNGFFIWEDIKFHIVQSVHIMDGYSIVPTFGLIMEDPDSHKKIYHTSDTQFNPNQIMDFYKSVDYIIQDCETGPFRSGVHAHYDELKTLPPEIKKKMRLVHYQDNVLAEDGLNINDEWLDKAIKDGFTHPTPNSSDNNWVIRGHIWEVQ